MPVVALVEADSPDEAILKLQSKIREQDLVPQDDGYLSDAFESELGVEADF